MTTWGERSLVGFIRTSWSFSYEVGHHLAANQQPPGSRSPRFRSEYPARSILGYHCCETWTVKKAEHQRIDAFQLWCWRRLLRIPWTARRSNQSILREIKPWIFTGRTEAEAPVFWSSFANRRLIGKVPDAGKDWGQKRVSEDKLSGCYHQRNGHELGQTPGDGEGQQGLACCSPWGCKESGMTVWLKHKVCAQEWDCWVLLRFFFKDFQHHFCVFKKSLHISNFKKVCFLGSYFLFF